MRIAEEIAALFTFSNRQDQYSYVEGIEIMPYLEFLEPLHGGDIIQAEGKTAFGTDFPRQRQADTRITSNSHYGC